jgi:hypothetical protein
MMAYALCRALAPAFTSIVVLSGLGLLFGLLLVAVGLGHWAFSRFDSGTKRAAFKARCNYLWSLTPQLYDHTHDGVMQGLMHQVFPGVANGQCWAFGIDTSGYPGYEAQGYLYICGSMLHLAVVAGVRGKWHIDSYCRASCSVKGSVFTIESICGPLTGWVGVGSKLGVNVDQAGEEGLRGGPFGYVQLATSGVPQVLRRFTHLAHIAE